MSKNPVLALVAAILGFILIVIAVWYWIEPAHALPAFFPGHEAGSNHHHTKHGIAAFVLGLGCFAYAWFASGKKSDATA